MKKSPLPVILLTGYIIAFFIRLLLIPNPGFEADISFWKSWGLAVLDFGIVKGLAVTNYNYPTPFGYFLALMPGVYRFFANPHNFNQYWQNTNLLFLIVSKMPAILADFGIAGLILWIGKHAKKLNFPELPLSFYAVLSLVFLFNPVTLIDGAWWGQVDSLGVIIFLGAFLLVLSNKPFLAGVIYMVAMLTKLQNMIYSPIFFLFLWEMNGLDGLLKGLAGSMVTFFGLNIEFILSHNMARVLESLTANYDYFPWLSLWAFNPWWIVSGGHGMPPPLSCCTDKMLSIGLMNAKTVGLAFFSGGYLLAMLCMQPFSFLRGRKETDMGTVIYRFLTAFVLVNASFFLFQTESHDRYAFPLVVFLLLWAAFWIRRHVTKKESLRIFDSWPLRIFFLFYALFSLFYFFNLHTALAFNYPNNAIPFLTSLIHPNLTIGVSYLLTGLFLLFVYAVRRDISLWTFVIPVGCILLLLTAKNLPLITKKPVLLTSLTPFAYAQDYGDREINMPVGAFAGFDKWGFLSVQYAFYRNGIGTHANSYQTFDVGRFFKTFSFDYGIDTEAGPKGTVVFEVYGDDKKLFASKIIGRYELPRHANVNIAGVKILKLVVTDAGDGNTDDHADWLNPKLYE